MRPPPSRQCRCCGRLEKGPEPNRPRTRSRCWLVWTVEVVQGTVRVREVAHHMLGGMVATIRPPFIFHSFMHDVECDRSDSSRLYSVPVLLASSTTLLRKKECCRYCM